MSIMSDGEILDSVIAQIEGERSRQSATGVIEISSDEEELDVVGTEQGSGFDGGRINDAIRNAVRMQVEDAIRTGVSPSHTSPSYSPTTPIYSPNAPIYSPNSPTYSLPSPPASAYVGTPSLRPSPPASANVGTPSPNPSPRDAEHFYSPSSPIDFSGLLASLAGDTPSLSTSTATEYGMDEEDMG